MQVSPFNSYPQQPQTVAIIGAGLSGTLVATHLLKQATVPLNIQLIERQSSVGRGIAYGTRCNCHLLNVPASKMSAFDDQPTHFLDWLQANAVIKAETDPFVPRRLYGDYIQSVLEEAIAQAPPQVKLERLVDEAIALKPDSCSVAVGLASGETVQADQVVLAVGNFPPQDPAVSDRSFYRSRRYVNAWSPLAMESVSTDQPVLLIGSGLTALDWVLSLREQGYRNVIHLVSRHGLRPQSHRATTSYPKFLNTAEAPNTVRGLMHCIRQEVKAAEARGCDWRAVIDALRPQTQELWQALPIAEKRRFLRHVRSYWEVHRHRVASAIADSTNQWVESKQVTIHAARIQAYREQLDGLDVLLRERCSHKTFTLQVGTVINCTGPPADYHKISHPLIANLLLTGLACPSALNLGLEIAVNGALIDAAGNPSKRLYTLGTLRRAQLWETTAVREIRQQAKLLAIELLKLQGGDGFRGIASSAVGLG